MAYGKKTFKEKFNAVAKKVLLWTCLTGAIGGPVAYEYGTIQTQEVKITGYEDNNDKSFVIHTDKGDFNMERSRLHGQSEEDVVKMWWPINSGDTYDIKTYGWHLIGNWRPNVIKAHEVTAEELQARLDAQNKKKEKEKIDALQKVSNNQNPSVTPTQNTVVPQTIPVTQPQTGLSGEVVTYPVTVNGYNVQLTVPVEAVGKVTVNTVKPIVPQQAPQQPPPTP